MLGLADEPSRAQTSAASACSLTVAALPERREERRGQARRQVLLSLRGRPLLKSHLAEACLLCLAFLLSWSCLAMRDQFFTQVLAAPRANNKSRRAFKRQLCSGFAQAVTGARLWMRCPVGFLAGFEDGLLRSPSLRRVTSALHPNPYFLLAEPAPCCAKSGARSSKDF